MSKRLPDPLDTALRIIGRNERLGIDMPVINTLLESGYIKHQYQGGWMLSSKGRRYLKEHNTV